MKRVRNLMPLIADMENLREAFLRASKGKRGAWAVCEFENDLDNHLSEIQTQLLNGTLELPNYHFFYVNDPKRRLICAAPFQMRVVFHAVMRICHPVFDNYQISHSFASRKGLGQYKALEKAKQFCYRYKWFAKLDVVKYFDSIDHQVLKTQLRSLFKDVRLLNMFDNLIDGYQIKTGRGLPVGNLTSQYFANHYLSLNDHYVKNQMRVKAYLRYMDDMLLFGDCKEDLMRQVDEIIVFISKSLKLELHVPVVNRTYFGVPFLGYVINDVGMRLNQRSRKRFKSKMAVLHKLLTDDIIDEKKYAERALCLHAFVSKADDLSFRCKMSRIKGLYP